MIVETNERTEKKTKPLNIAIMKNMNLKGSLKKYITLLHGYCRRNFEYKCMHFLYHLISIGNSCQAIIIKRPQI